MSKISPKANITNEVSKYHEVKTPKANNYIK